MKVFISYSVADRDFALRLANDLALYEIDVWIDDWAIRAGDSVPASIQDGLGSADHLVVLISQRAIASSWVQTELNSALYRAITSGRPKVVPLLLEPCLLPPMLAERKAVTFADPENYVPSLEALVSHLFQNQRHGQPPMLVIPGFRSVKILGEGGFSTVYMATEVATGQLKAIKIPKGRVQLDREALIARRVQDHVGVVPIERSFPFGGRTVLVMPYAGKSLKWHVARQKIRPQHIEQIIDWMRALAGIMAHAHSKGVVHGDLKPANILIDEFGVIRIVDFGISQTLEHVEFQKSTMVRGTICYMSPEQWQGELPTFRSDVYSFGAVFYELVTGEKPLGRFKNPRELNGALPPAIDWLIDRCLQTAPANRVDGFDEITTRLNAPRAPIETRPDTDFIADSPAMQQIRTLVERVTLSRISVLIEGETGTGKEVVARLIGSRAFLPDGRAAPFVAVHCAAMPEALSDSILFGHEKNAFTGASTARVGLIESADQGTILLDEVDGLPHEVQRKLLRFLEEREVRPVGALKSRRVDVRVLATSSTPLAKLVSEGKFAGPLFYRLSGLSITLPPLRERGPDLRALAQHFLGRCQKELAREHPAEFDEDALELMESYSWPGNVRELRNLVERLVILSTENRIAAHEVFFHLSAGHAPITLSAALARATSESVRDALFQAGQDHAKAAKALGVSTKRLHTLMREHGFARHPRLRRSATASSNE